METIVNQINAVATMINERNRTMYVGVVGLITNVNRLKKNRVTFGFRILVKNPILKACIKVRSSTGLSLVSSNFDFFAKMELIPI